MLAKTIIKTYESEDFKTVEIDEFSYFISVGTAGLSTLEPNEDGSRKTKDGVPIAITEDFPQETSASRSLRRAKKQVKELILNNCGRDWKFVTLTYRGEGNHSEQSVKDDIKAMVRRVEAWAKRDIKYVGVTEWHKSEHGLHVHLVMNLPYIENDKFASDLWTHGFTKIEKLDTSPKKGSIINIVSYLLKYLMKDADESAPFRHLYLRSRNLREVKDVTYSQWVSGEVDNFTEWLERSNFVMVKRFTVEISPGFTMIRSIFVKNKPPECLAEKLRESFRGEELF